MMAISKSSHASKLGVVAAVSLAARSVQAHCPLCTAGAAVAAGSAAALGVHEGIIGLFIGAFAASTGLWLSRMVPQRIPFQNSLIVIGSFLATVIPLMPVLSSAQGVYVDIAGSYGSLLNRTYLVDLFLAYSIYGGSIVSISPRLSSLLTSHRGYTIPFQGITITFTLLLFSAIALQVW